MLLCKKSLAELGMLVITTPVGKEFHSLIVLGKNISISSGIRMDVG